MRALKVPLDKLYKATKHIFDGVTITCRKDHSQRTPKPIGIKMVERFLDGSCPAFQKLVHLQDVLNDS